MILSASVGASNSSVTEHVQQTIEGAQEDKSISGEVVVHEFALFVIHAMVTVT